MKMDTAKNEDLRTVPQKWTVKKCKTPSCGQEQECIVATDREIC